jgi:hypothetical protein
MKLPKDVQSIIDAQTPKLLRVPFEQALQKRFETLKNQMINEFLNHPVSQEISGGPEASNSSGSLGGYGNLFSFIGFEEDDEPLKPILEQLQATNFIYSGEVASGVKFSILLPTAKEIFEVTPMPWASGRSWAKGIESGISGLGFYLKLKSKNSRSGEGIQTSVKANTRRFKNQQYISLLINKYTNLFAQLK